MFKEEKLTNLILGKAFEVHSLLGPGLLESAYRDCLMYELVNAGLRVKRELMLPLISELLTPRSQNERKF
ncbi:MAG: GxxExxY protein [Bacteroidetes bacterium]|nr:GxxExxY protein [Bacteroidota bacterium]